MDWTQVFFKSWFRLRNGLTTEGDSDPTKPSDAPKVTPTDAA